MGGYPGIYELLLPDGPAGPSEPIFPGTLDPTTGKLKAWIGADPNGNVGSPYFSTKQETSIITSAQLLALAGTPVTLVPAVAGVYHSVVQVIFEYLHGTVGYAGAGNLQVGLGATASFGNFVSSALVLTSTTANSIDDQLGEPQTPPYPNVDVVNIPIQLSISGGPFTLGNGTVKVTTFYRDFLA